MRRSQCVMREKFREGKSIASLQGFSGILVCCTCWRLFLFLFLFFFPPPHRNIHCSWHEAPGAKDGYLCPEYSSSEGIVSELRRWCGGEWWLDLTEQLIRYPGCLRDTHRRTHTHTKHLKAEVWFWNWQCRATQNAISTILLKAFVQLWGGEIHLTDWQFGRLLWSSFRLRAINIHVYHANSLPLTILPKILNSLYRPFYLFSGSGNCIICFIALSCSEKWPFLVVNNPTGVEATSCSNPNISLPMYLDIALHLAHEATFATSGVYT